MKFISGCIILIFGILPAFGQISIEEVSYLNRLHYRVSTSAATYFIDRQSGGISGMFDKDYVDWIQWEKSDDEHYPESAASDYRGLPNLVFGGDDNGVGHPGFDKAMSFKEGLTRVRVRSLNGKWEFLYSFYPEFAELEIIKSPEYNRNYWFLYEGVPGGEYNSERIYWGTNSGIKVSKPDYFKNEEVYGDWQWAFFGNENTKRVFYVVQKGKDNLQDMFGFLGNSEQGINAENGMVVFGFGRGEEATPLINKSNIFYFGFFEKFIDDKSFPKLEKYIQKTFFY